MSGRIAAATASYSTSLLASLAAHSRMCGLYRAAQRATQARDDVLAIVSHDLRNPLHTIILSASYLADVFLADLPDAALQQTEIIRRAVDRANRLIQDLLDVSRIEAGGFSVNKEPVSPATLIGDAFEAMKSTASAAQVTLESHADDGLPDVCADRERLQQVFSNLVGNAIKFTPAGGTVAVTARSNGPRSVSFSVKDTGQGISEDNLPHIFDRFWQAEEREAHRCGPGTGDRPRDRRGTSRNRVGHQHAGFGDGNFVRAPGCLAASRSARRRRVPDRVADRFLK